MRKNRKDALIPSLIIVVFLIIMQAFWQNVSGEVIGGIFGGLVVFSAALLWYKYRTFRIRFLSTEGRLTAEHMRQYTAIRADIGLATFRVIIIPRIGVDLVSYNFAFFDRGKLPWLVGRRRSTNDIKVTGMRYYNGRLRKWVKVDLENSDNEGITSDQPSFSLASGSRAYYDLDTRIANTLKEWEGVLSFKLFFQRGGNPEAKSVRTKFFVRASDKQRPMRSIFKKVLKCEPTKSIPDIGDYQR
ncbi:hypothetical protein ACFLVN_01420 [Chloroflexota bacterium]